MISSFIYGLHDRGGEHLLNGRGWVYMTEAIGCDPQDRSSVNYSDLVDQGLGMIVRLNNGYGSKGTIPTPDRYSDFARRVGHFVSGSQGCRVWQLGNEPNHEQERPMGQVIEPEMYARCYDLCRNTIKNLAGHETDLVLLAPVAPWNEQTGDWLEYMAAMIEAAGNIDGFAIHTYTHGADPGLITSMETMHPPYEDRLFHFRAYWDLLDVIPAGLRDRPVFITETNQGDGPWLNHNNGWIQEAYHEVNDHNQASGTQKIQALILYRWNDHDHWQISDKPGVHEDLRAAVAWGWRWPQNDAQIISKEESNNIYLPNVQAGQPESTPEPEPDRVWDPRLDERGAELIEADVEPGQRYLRLVKGEWFDKKESGGRHHVYVKVIDDEGLNVEGLRFAFKNGGTENKRTGEPTDFSGYALNFAMWNAGTPYAISPVTAGDPVDHVRKLGFGSIDQPHHTVHTSYGFIWQWVTAQEAQDGDSEGDASQPPKEPETPQDGPGASAGDRFKEAVRFVFDIEGGLSMDPRDPGNWTGCLPNVGELKGTKYGISACSFPHLDIKNLTKEEALNIYREKYWLESGAHRLPWPLALVHFDSYVQNKVMANKMLTQTHDPLLYLARRLRWYTTLGGWPDFGAGWSRRVADLMEVVTEEV